MNPPPAAHFLEFRLSDSADAARWDEIVSRSAQADVYHRSAYVLASAELEHSDPIGLIVSLNDHRYLLPMLLRPISTPNEQTWLDASTPYGYGGVIRLDAGPQSAKAADLFHALRDWCATRNLISCVLRSHPLLEQDWLFAPVDPEFVGVTRRGQTVALPLQGWDDIRQCPPELSKGRRSDLALARRNLQVTLSANQSEALENLKIFRTLYENTMQRVQATDFFHFPWSYYERLARLGKDIGVALTWHSGCAVGGAVFMAGPTFAHYHLSASDSSGHKFKASTLLVVEGAKWARQRGCHTMHLGGGMVVNDSLMAFKRSFGGNQYHFGHVTLIGDRVRFDSMCSLSNPPWPYDRKLTKQTPRSDANTPLRVILMGKDKPVVRKGLDYLLENGFCVIAVVGPDNGSSTGRRLVDIAVRRGIPTTTDQRLYDVLEGRASPNTLPFQLDNIDLVISLLFWKRIRKPLIQLPKIACINFHPAPLPEFRGIGGYNVAILENLMYWGAAVHVVDESFDTGDLIDVRNFDIEPSRETAFSLEQKTQAVLFDMFKETMTLVKRDRKFTRKPQGEGRYISREEFERLRRIQPDDPPETIARKVRAFWYPPNGGASIVLNGTEYTVIDQEMLARLAKRSE